MFLSSILKCKKKRHIIVLKKTHLLYSQANISKIAPLVSCQEGTEVDTDSLVKS